MNGTMNKFLRLGLVIIVALVLVLLTHEAMPIIIDFLHYLYHLLLPFLAAFFLAFLLHTLVDKLERKGINRLVAVLFIYLIFFVLIAYLFSVLVPILGNQVRSLNERMPELYKQTEEWISNFWTKLPIVPEQYHFNLNDIGNFAEKEFFNLNNLGHIRLSTVFDSFGVIILTPIIAFYFLYDYNNIKKKVKRFLTRNRYRYLYKIMQNLENGLGSYFRGLILVMNLLTLFATILFMFTKLDYPLLFGFLIGYTNVIPIVGPYIGGIPAVLYAMTISFKTAIAVAVIIVLAQFLESNFITPYIQSKSIDTHPLLILFAIVIFGKLMGILGMIFAIPLLYMILLIIKYIRISIRLKRAKRKLNLESTSIHLE